MRQVLIVVRSQCSPPLRGDAHPVRHGARNRRPRADQGQSRDGNGHVRRAHGQGPRQRGGERASRPTRSTASTCTRKAIAALATA